MLDHYNVEWNTTVGMDCWHFSECMCLINKKLVKDMVSED